MKGKNIKLILLIVAVLLGIATFFMWSNRKVFVGSITKSSNEFILEFEKMNLTDSHMLNLYKDDVLSVDYKINNGYVDLFIGMEREKSIYIGNGISCGQFDVVVPKDGEYEIKIKASNAEGFISINAEAYR